MYINGVVVFLRNRCIAGATTIILTASKLPTSQHIATDAAFNDAASL